MTQILSTLPTPCPAAKDSALGSRKLAAGAPVAAKDATWTQLPALAPALVHLLASAGRLPQAPAPSNRDVNGAEHKAQAVQALATVNGRKELAWLRGRAQDLGLLPAAARAPRTPSPLGGDGRPSRAAAPAPTALHRPRPDDEDVMWTRPIAKTLGPKNVRAQLALLSAPAHADAAQAGAARTRAATALLDPGFRRELVSYLNRRGYVLERTEGGSAARPARQFAASEQKLLDLAEVQKLARRWGLVTDGADSSADAAEFSKPKKFNCYGLDNSDHGDALLQLEAYEVPCADRDEGPAEAKKRRRAMAQVLTLSFDPARANEAKALLALTRRYNALPRLGEQTSNSAGARKSIFGLGLVELFVDDAATAGKFSEQDDADAKRAMIAYGVDEDARFDRVAPRTMLKFAEPAWGTTMSTNARAKQAKASA